MFVKDAVRHLVRRSTCATTSARRLGALTDKQLVQPDPLAPPRRRRSASTTSSSATPPTRGSSSAPARRYHEQFVEWADSVNREGATEYEEILGYHLEQAHRYLSELGPLDDHGRALGGGRLSPARVGRAPRIRARRRAGRRESARSRRRPPAGGRADQARAPPRLRGGAAPGRAILGGGVRPRRGDRRRQRRPV